MKPYKPGYFLLPYKLPRFIYQFVMICLLFISPLSLSAQDSQRLNIEKVQDESLTDNYITCISQDKNGFIWVTGKEGLFRYDGYSFTAFSNLPGAWGMINNVIPILYPDGNRLWVGSVGGLSYIDIDSQTATNIHTPEPFRVYAIVPKNDSVMWIGTSKGLFQYNKINYRWKNISTIPENLPIVFLCKDKQGCLYFPANHGIYCYAGSATPLKFYPLNLLYYPQIDKNSQPVLGKPFVDDNGMLWLCTWGGGLVRLNTQTGKVKQWIHLTDDVHLLPYKIVADILPDKNGNIWLANKEAGLTIFNPSTNKFTNYPVDWKSENKLSSAVISLFRDRSGNVWIGTENGIFKYDPNSFHLSRTDMLLKTNTGVEESHNSPTAMLKNNDSTLWIGMYEGIFRFDQKTGVLTDYSKAFGLPQNLAVFNILREGNGTVWFTARNCLVKVSEKTGDKSSPYKAEIFKSNAISSTITRLYIDKEKRMWVGTFRNGIFRFDPVLKKFIYCGYNETGPEGKINEIDNFCELSADSLLIGGQHTGLLLLHIKSGRYDKVQRGGFSTQTANPSITVIYKNRGDLWIGAENYGLWHTDSLLKSPLTPAVNDMSAMLNIATLTAGKNNNLWLLTNSGIIKFQTDSKKVRVFDRKDGIQSLDHIFSIITDGEDNLTIGGRGCLYNLSPSQIEKNMAPPAVFITGLKVFDKVYNTDKTLPIELNYNQNYFSLAYVALNYTHSRLNKYAYKMDGLDKKWNDAGSRRYVSYANLEEGTYTFNVKACNNEGVWNNTPARLVLIINPPFWHRWWFYLLILAFIASIIYILYTYNIHQLKIRLQMRDKIARDLHDDIGSTLSGINIFSKIALQKIGSDSDSSRELLAKISERSEKTMDALSDIVWSINTRNDGMDNFLIKANEYLSEMLEVQGIDYNFKVDEDTRHLKLGMILRKELYLIFKEAICNASKYAKCTFIQLKLARHKDACTLTIHDNGVGFNTAAYMPGNGIYNMQQRAKKLNAEFNIESNEATGTLITFKFHIPRFR